MKALHKITYALFAAAMALGPAACAAPASPAPADPTSAPVATEVPATAVPAASPTEAPAAGLTADGRYPAEPVKICVETFDPADSQYKGVQDYLNYLSEKVFNVEYIYSEAIASAEQELQFVENCAAGGGKGYIAYYNVSKGQVVAKALELGIYYWGLAEEADVYTQFQDDPHYLGSVILGNGDYDGMFAVTQALIAQGKTKLIYANGGADFGVTMFVNRRLGFQAAVDEATKAGTAVTVNEVPGFPDESWFAAQGAALAGDVDGVVGSFGAEVWAQPILSANKADAIKVVSFGAINDFYKQMFESGLVTAVAAEPTERFGIGVAQIVNAVDGNAEALEDGGAATNAAQSLWIVKSTDEFNALYAFETGEGRQAYSKTLTQLIKNLNPEANIDTLRGLIDGYTLKSILGGN